MPLQPDSLSEPFPKAHEAERAIRGKRVPSPLATTARALLLLPLLATASVAADWQPIHRTVTYPVTGRSGITLYESIGHKGPVVGKGIRAIAHTDFRLTWTRKYENRGTACVLASAKPKLIITYTLPKAVEPLPQPTRENWATFVAGITRHERGHGVFIEELARAIEAATVGLTVPDDPRCQKIKTEMTTRLGALSRAERQKSADYDRAEMGDGGTIQQLVLALVNGG